MGKRLTHQKSLFHICVLLACWIVGFFVEMVKTLFLKRVENFIKKEEGSDSEGTRLISDELKDKIQKAAFLANETEKNEKQEGLEYTNLSKILF